MKIEIKDYIKKNIIRDIEEMADDVSVVLDMADDNDITPAEEMAKLIDFAKENDIDFWEIVEKNCSKYEERRLKHIFDGKDLDDFANPIAPRPVYRQNLGGLGLHAKVEKPKNTIEDSFTKKDGKTYITRNQAKKLFQDKPELVSEFYYVALNDVGGFFCTTIQKEGLIAKKDREYAFWPAPTVEEFKELGYSEIVEKPVEVVNIMTTYLDDTQIEFLNKMSWFNNNLPVNECIEKCQIEIKEKNKNVQKRNKFIEIMNICENKDMVIKDFFNTVTEKISTDTNEI